MAFTSSLLIHFNRRVDVLQRSAYPDDRRFSRLLAVSSPPKISRIPRPNLPTSSKWVPSIPTPKLAVNYYVSKNDEDTCKEEDTEVEGIQRELRTLLKARGALSRGLRACLRALYVRGKFIYDESTAKTGGEEKLYMEFSPAYAIAVSLGRVTRYAVEQKAWPELRRVLKWEEVTKHEARNRGARLRTLRRGGYRYGRHLFVSRKELGAALEVAECLLEDGDWEGRKDSGNIEAVISLKRLPQSGVRTVAAKCPRSAQHSNYDRRPSLMLWMNSDGVTGGAMCPVCLDDSLLDNSARLHGKKHCPPRNLTWRVSFENGNKAVLFTPNRRQEDSYLSENGAAIRVENGRSRIDELQENTLPREKRRRVARKSPVGGCVARSGREVELIGTNVKSAYVTATLKSVAEFEEETVGDAGYITVGSSLVRTVGTMAKQACPMKILLSADRRSTWSNEVKRVENLSWFARQSYELDAKQEKLSEEQSRSDLDVTGWQPVGVLSVSAMRVSAWREIIGAGGEPLRAPAAWEAAQQQWIVIDLDDMTFPDENVVNSASKSMIRVARRNVELSGRCVVVQTGPKGLHLWAELREIRERSREWFAKDETRLWYANLGNALLKAARRCGAIDGKVDMSSCSAGRFARRPGWRILEDGTPFRSRIVMLAANRVKSRSPRYIWPKCPGSSLPVFGR